MHRVGSKVFPGERARRLFPLHAGIFIVVGMLSGNIASAQAPSPSPISQTGGPLRGHEQSSSTADVQSSSSQPPTTFYATPGTHVIVPENTKIQVVTDQALSTKRSKAGTPVLFTVNEDVVVNHVLAIPRGAMVHGEVVEDKKAGIAHGSPELILQLDSLDIRGESYALYAYQFKVQGASREKPIDRNVAAGAFYGAIAGDAVAGSTNASLTRKVEAEDMAAGAAAGAGTVAAAAVIKPRPVVSIPPESQMEFYLAAPISVLSVSPKEAEQLSQRLPPGTPVLYVRGETPQ